MLKAILQERYSCSVQKSAPKNTKYSRKRQLWKSAILQRLYSPCKDYSLWKIVSFDQKWKMPKTYEKRFYKNVTVVLCKKPLQKNPKYSRNGTILKIGHLAKMEFFWLQRFRKTCFIRNTWIFFPSRVYWFFCFVLKYGCLLCKRHALTKYGITIKFVHWN